VGTARRDKPGDISKRMKIERRRKCTKKSVVLVFKNI
jgi:hypothetical protein